LRAAVMNRLRRRSVIASPCSSGAPRPAAHLSAPASPTPLSPLLARRPPTAPRGQGAADGGRTTGAGRGFGGNADVLVPEFAVEFDEALHEFFAAAVAQDDDLSAGVAEPVLPPLERDVLADDDAGDAVENGGAAAHGAGA